MKHKEPFFVSVWKRGIIPKCCHTCLFYLEDGICDVCKQEPPETFASDLDKCQQWRSYDGIPF